MRIIRVIPNMGGSGGAENSTLVEAEELAERGHELLVVTLSSEPSTRVSERLDQSGIEHRHLTGSIVAQAYSLRKLVRSWRPDVVHAVIWRAEIVTALAGISSGTPSVASLVNMQYDPRAVASAQSPRRLDLVRRFEGLILRHGFDAIHCLTDAVKEHSVEHLGVDPGQIVVIPRGRSSQQLTVGSESLQAARQELAGEGEVVLLNIGRHELQKGQELLIEVTRILVDQGYRVRLLIAGREGNETVRLKRKISELGLDGVVSLLGPRTDISTLLGATDIVCVGSRWEGLGGAIVEALGAGRPIVAFGVPAVAETVGGAGVLVEPFNTVEYANSVAGLLDDGSRRSQLGEAAKRRFAEVFELSNVIDEIERMYTSLVEA